MPRILAALLCGLLFGAGLSVSGMINPAKVLNFLDLAGHWDASLVFVMAGAVAVTFVGYRLVFGRERPLFGEDFSLPSSVELDERLLLGATIFGAGWGVAGYCPGPALASLLSGKPATLIFLAAMLIGLVAGRMTAKAMSSPPSMRTPT